MKKTLIAAIAATSILGAIAQPAAAIERTYSVQSTTSNSSGHTLNQGANARVITGDPSTVTVELDCFANTSPPAIAVGIQACYIRGSNGARYDATDIDATPGPVTATSGVFHGIPRQHYRVCVDSQAFWSEGSNFVDAALVCSA